MEEEIEEEEELEDSSEKRANIKYTLAGYWSFLKNYKLIMIVILFLVFILEARHILESYLFKVLIDKGTLFSSGGLALADFTHILIILVGVFAIIIFSGFSGRWIEQHLVNILESKMITDLKTKYFNHLLDLDHEFHTNNKTGTLIARLSRGGGAMERITDVLVYNIASVVFGFLVAIASLIYFDALSAIIIVIIIIIFTGYSYLMQTISQKANVLANDSEDYEKGHISDIFTNIESIKYFGKESYIKKKFSNIIESTKNAFLKHWNYFRWIDSVQSITIGVGTLLLLYFPIKKFMNGEMSLGTVVFIYTVYGTMIEPLYEFVYGLRSVYGAMADFQSLFEYGEIQKKVEDKPNARNIHIENGEIEFKNVNFHFGNRKIFEDFNLSIEKNKKIALVGHSGSGKSTFVKLLYRLYDIYSGQILIDGQDIRDFKQESLRSEMSIVPQECVLFDDTIYNNIAFSNPAASKEDVMNAIKFAQLDKTIENFPKKEKTIVGERGIKLSGGEKQRVSIARAILADRKILVLDEATSALDSETEYEIQKSMAKLMEGRTSIIIAHRLSTIMHADRIIVLKNGKIIQEGKHSQLINQEGEYKKLWELQKSGYLIDSK